MNKPSCLMPDRPLRRSLLALAVLTEHLRQRLRAPQPQQLVLPAAITAKASDAVDSPRAHHLLQERS